jgi:hypothetical protein
MDHYMHFESVRTEIRTRGKFTDHYVHFESISLQIIMCIAF